MVSARSFSKYQQIAGQEGSFAHFTITERLPVILDRILKDNLYDDKTNSKLKLLRDNLAKGKIEHLPTKGPDIKSWETYVKPYLGNRWVEVPFFFAEAYFYRMILDAISYFESRVDPFLIQKKRDIEENLTGIEQLIKKFENGTHKEKSILIGELLKLSLWGNKADLSQLKISRHQHEDKLTLIDDSEKVVDFLKDGVSRLDVILDNSGMELFTDMLMASWLIGNKLTDQVILHAKAYPTFVSDAVEDDVSILLDYLRASSQSSARKFAETFGHYLEKGRIMVASNEFWNSPLHFYEMPGDLFGDLSTSDLIIYKGDANYRRVFGDRQIPYDLSPVELAGYLPSKNLAVRILKSELVTGLDKETVEELVDEDADWLISGSYGMIQLLNFH